MEGLAQSDIKGSDWMASQMGLAVYSTVNPDHWAAVIKPGMILFEVGGVDLALAQKALELAGDKLPVLTKVAYKPTKD